MIRRSNEKKRAMIRRSLAVLSGFLAFAVTSALLAATTSIDGWRIIGISFCVGVFAFLLVNPENEHGY